MNAPMELPRHALTIADTFIRQDADGRYCLNDLHHASGGEKRHGPSYWLTNAQTKELVAELGGAGIPVGPVATLNDGRNNGTYVVKELVYAYAMWISAAFHLKVIRAYDAMVTAPQHLIPQSLPEALRLAADLADQKAKVEAQLAIAAPKVEALERFSNHEGKHNLRSATKVLGIQESKLKAWLLIHKWYYRDHGGRLCAYAEKIATGYLDTIPVEIPRSDGVQVVPQPVITQKGLTRLAELLAKDGLLPKEHREAA